tara:strand:- start:1240 stop:1743 length:504 start_codon:yes stop_codon:yes gene_type:complete
MDLNYKGILYNTYEKLNMEFAVELGTGVIDTLEFNKLREEILPFLRKERGLSIIEWWRNFNTPMLEPKDVPNTNVFGEDYQNYVIPALIRNGAIAKKDIKNGHFYHGQWRSGEFGEWDEEKGQFHIWRNKWSQWYLDQANHFEDDDNYALFVPLKEITEEQFNNKKL